jgi:hypothetical protein
MDKKKFEQVLDQVAEDWYIDSNPPVRGTYTSDNHSPTGPRRRVNKRGEFMEQNISGGFPQVAKFRPIEEFCDICNKTVYNRTVTINLILKTKKCDCPKRPIKITSL